jgi:hypothetical protein
MAKGKRQEAEEEGRLPGYFSRSIQPNLPGYSYIFVGNW